ncbi:RibD family protein [Candidatus Phycosocius spiralis]|uniref:Bacterial bifunctional deaminase-reductase C-terminal domain-containing protein n=1 Tax=Candidatus Phycosocius spiralis TaxID=2815099 RepID=A0ABQ4PSA8_9PROT|nr:RibD family protein [Candidatus Phycosocius spiralis]GIU65893.1 hypothetical protein PsB1_0047 [Candidatus Phycosocius spiralis]
MNKPNPRQVNVTLKLATSLDARIATVIGASQWITGSLARQEVHRMRASYDCIITGIGTVLADDPLLTARYGQDKVSQPLRALLDTHARLPATAKLVTSSDQGQVVWFTKEGGVIPAWASSLGIKHHNVPIAGSYSDASKHTGAVHLDLAATLTILERSYGVRSLMIEAGPSLASSFLRAGLVNTIAWFRAPILLGGDGRSVFESLGVVELAQAWRLHKIDTQSFGPDLLETYKIEKQ